VHTGSSARTLSRRAAAGDNTGLLEGGTRYVASLRVAFVEATRRSAHINVPDLPGSGDYTLSADGERIAINWQGLLKQ
jgi:hypothetical protein